MRVRKGTPMKEVMSKYAQNKGARRRRGTGRRGARVSRARRARVLGPSLVGRTCAARPGTPFLSQVKADRLSWKRRASARESVIISGTVPGKKGDKQLPEPQGECGYSDCGCTGYA